MGSSTETGKRGEQLAEEYLKIKGYDILERNFRFQKAEIDIIAKKANLLIAVEVKTRSSDAFGNPQDFLKPKQIQRIVMATDHYVLLHDLDVEVRFDIISIITNKAEPTIEHLENAFYHF